MKSVIGTIERKKEKYGIELGQKPELRNLKLLYGIYVFLIFTDFIMPQYFGVHIGYDITCTRFANIIITLYFVCNPKLFTHFAKTILECPLTIPIVLYLMVAGYTMVFRVDINALFLVFLELLTLYMLIYGIRYVVGYKRAINWSLKCAYFLGFYGVVEFVYGKSIFLQFLSTVPTAVVNSYRSGHYRIMGPCGHALGYGLLLILFIALACIDLERNELYLFKRPVLLVVLYINVFLTGSRSTLGLSVVEAIVILLFSNRRNAKKTLFILLMCILGMAVFLVLFYKTAIGNYLMGQITSVIDQIFGTTYATNFGIETERLQDSTEYRKVLPLIFELDWLNPIVGRGAKGFGGAEINGIYIHSIDNYYVMQYIKYAYPGLITYILFMLFVLVMLIRDVIVSKSAVSKMVLIAGVFYFWNLWWVDALQTLKFMYVFIAIFYAGCLERKSTKELIVKREVYEREQSVLHEN